MDTNKNESIENQVKKILSGLDGEDGEFLSQEPKTKTSEPDGIQNFGILLGITLAFKCEGECGGLHTMGMAAENFVELFFGDKPAAIFENFQVGLEAARYREQEWAKLEELMVRCDASDKALAKGKKLLTKVQALADRTTIENSHLKVENDVLRRELDRFRAGGEVGQTETALDFNPGKGRRWNLWTAFKGFRLIGSTGEGK
jgi:hypothetical protein